MKKFQLFHQGIKVEFSTYTVHSRLGKIESMSGELYQLDKQPSSEYLKRKSLILPLLK
jgi:hypothetical protein